MTTSLPVSRRAVLGTLAATLVDLRGVAAQTPPGPRILEAKPGTADLAAGKSTNVLTYDGVVSGPLLRVKKDEDVRLRLRNGLDQPTTLHWHGLRGDNAVDGIGGLTQKPVAPGQTFDIAFKAIDPGFLLYRPAALPWSPEQIARGLCGALVVDEPQPPEVDADHLLIVQDFALDAKGAVAGPFDDPKEAVGGRIGATLTIGGKPLPFAQTVAPGARVRLRICNAANARIMLVVFQGVRPKIIAIDGQPCDPFEPVRLTIPIAPGARFDLLMDLPADEKAVAKIVLHDAGGCAPDVDLATWTTHGEKAKARPPIVSLPLNPLLPPEIKLGQAKKLELTLEPPKTNAKNARWTIGGVSRSYADKPLFTVPRGSSVSMGFANRSAVAVPICVHGHVVRLLHDLDDGWEPYWRNGVIVPPGKSKHVAFLADAPGKWALRSDNVEQEAAGLATWFEVT